MPGLDDTLVPEPMEVPECAIVLHLDIISTPILAVTDLNKRIRTTRSNQIKSTQLTQLSSINLKRREDRT